MYVTLSNTNMYTECRRAGLHVHGRCSEVWTSSLLSHQDEYFDSTTHSMESFQEKYYIV
jgi:hypothetical protein